MSRKLPVQDYTAARVDKEANQAEDVEATQAAAAQIDPPSTHSSTVFHEGQHIDITHLNMLPFRYFNTLGLGGSATVGIVEDQTTGQRFAHKVFRRYNGPDLEKHKQSFRNEIEIIKRLHSHSHIIQVFGSYACGRVLGMLLIPVANEGDLGAYLQEINDAGMHPTEKQYSVLYQSFGCLASGLAFIHKHTIRHKDIKPQNILVHDGRIIYADFGIALDASGQDTTTTGPPEAFTRRYCAPEVAKWDRRNRKSDVFSLGCVFMEIMAVLEPDIETGASNSHPYWDTVVHIRNCLIRFSTSDSRRDQLFRVCHAMLEPENAHRIGAEALLRRLLSIQSSLSDPEYELFCSDCASSEQDAVPFTLDRLALHGLAITSGIDGEVSDLSTTQNVTDDNTAAATSQGVGLSHEDVRLLEKYGPFQNNQVLLPHKTYRYSTLSIQAAIREVAKAPLREVSDGFLYIFSSLDHPGFVRIGWTRNVPRRLKQWEHRCKCHFQEYVQLARGERILIKHASRVLRLVEVELKEVRFEEIRCKGCQLRHKEWYRTAPEHAARIIKKYSDWTARNPYQFDGTSNKWILRKQTETHEMDMLCEPVHYDTMSPSLKRAPDP